MCIRDRYDVDIVLPNGKSAAAGEVGEIVINTKNSIPCGLFKGYYNSEELTREAWHDGVYHMGCLLYTSRCV